MLIGISKWLTYTGSTISCLTSLIDGDYTQAAFSFTTFVWCFMYFDLKEKNGIRTIREDNKSSE